MSKYEGGNGRKVAVDTRLKRGIQREVKGWTVGFGNANLVSKRTVRVNSKEQWASHVDTN